MATSKKDTAVSFLKMVVSGKIHEAYQTYVSPQMRHHNMYFKGDAVSLEDAMEENQALFPNKILNIKHALEDGDVVAVHSHLQFKPDDIGFATFHLFRFEEEKIVEMWDLGQPVPPDSINKNGMF